MSNHLPRYKVIPYLNDTTGFFGYNVPYTNQSQHVGNDSLKKYYNFSIYDYLTPVAKHIGSNPGPSIFQGHSLSHTYSAPKHIYKESNDWSVILITVCLLLIAWIQTNYSKRLRQIFRSVALPYYVNQLEREGNLYNERITLGLGFIYLTSLSFLIYQFSIYFGKGIFPYSNFLLFVFIFIGLIVYIAVKTTLIQATGIIFKTREESHAYRLNTLIFNHTIGISVFPVILFSLFFQVTPFLWIAAGIASILLFYRFLRGTLIGFSNSKFPVFYLILYLCTLEILPLVLLIKFIRQI
ncbi:MAG: DUF4271 domain-containing protein [Bacteroidetes bacterium]|nr:DUF4271 domain-containing protein [Bacteroidota bacterium]